MYKILEIDKKIVDLVNSLEKDCLEEFKKIDELVDYNSLKVLSSFHKNEVTEAAFNQTTGYGYNDLGRDKIEAIFRDVLDSEDALVRSQFISGSHALNVAFFALLRPGDILLSISGKPYDTLDQVIGIKENPSSLISFGIKYHEIDLVEEFSKLQLKGTTIDKTRRKKEIYILIIGGTNINYLKDNIYVSSNDCESTLPYTKYFSDLSNAKIFVLDRKENTEEKKYKIYKDNKMIHIENYNSLDTFINILIQL